MSLLPRHAVIAALMLVSSWLALKLAVPPGYASPLWPPAGIALAAVLLWGRRMWPAILLGSFALNLWNGSAGGTAFPTPAILAAFGIAGGSVLQALCAAWLAQRFVEPGLPRLDDPRRILKFILLTGPLGCLIAASVGVATLYGLGIQPGGTAFFSWWNWWIGDSLGAIIVTPIMLCLFAGRDTLWAQRRISVALPLATSLLVMLIAFVLVFRAEQTRLQLAFDIDAAASERLLTERARNLLYGSLSLQDFFAASQDIDAQEFSAFARGVLARHPEFQALEWLPRVTRAQRAAFEQALRQQGHRGFRITEAAADGSVATAAERDEYFPVLYVEPWAGNEIAFGFDSSSNPASRQAKQRARETGALSVSPRLRLVQETAGQYAVLISVPVYEKGTRALRGFVSGIVRPVDLVERLRSTPARQPLQVSLEDLSAAPAERELYTTASTHPATLEYGLRHWQNRFTFGDREWRITITPDRDFVLANSTLLPWITLLGGLLFTGLLNVYLLSFSGRTAYIQSQVDRRTRELHASEQRLNDILDNISAYIYIKDLQGNYTYANRRVCELWNVTPEQLIGHGDERFFDAETAARLRDSDRRVLVDGETLKTEETNLVAHSGTRATYWTVKVPLRDQDGRIHAMLGVSTDISERIQAEEKLKLASRVFSNAHEGIAITDANGIIIEVNPTFCAITGYSRDEVIGRSPDLLHSGKEPDEFHAGMWQSLREHGHWQGEVWHRKKNGSLYAELLTISALPDEHGDIRHYIHLFSDITQIKQQQQTLELMAHYDALTHLPNRVLFADRFSQAIAHAKREKSLLAVCYFDLDGFKQVNDTLGHEAGDRLLVEVANRIRAALREEDSVSRLGGDEFALLLGDIATPEQCEQAIQRIHHTLALPYDIDGQPVHIAASSGVTLYPQDDADPDTLLRHADQAMYQAKLEGRNRYCFYDPAQDLQAQQHRDRLQTIELAFARGEFVLHYQPKVNMKTGAVVGVEALIRWQHPVRGLLAPMEFLPVLEGTRMAITLGDWVIEQALQQLEQWRAEGLDIRVSVNISPQHLQSPGFFAALEAALARHPETDARALELEVLESSAIDNLAETARVIDECHNLLGVTFALDDFGTGYSSLNHLRHLQASTVKIDQSFVRDLVDDPDDYAIVEGVIGLSRAFRREAIAEGVETVVHGQILICMECCLGQGYAIARPMPAAEVPHWMCTWQPRPEWKRLGEQRYDKQEMQLLILDLELEHWLQRIEQCLAADAPLPSGWPLADQRKCHLGRWLGHLGQQRGIDQQRFNALQQAHAAMHQLAGLMRQQLQDGRRDEARLSLPRLRSLQATTAKLLRRVFHPAGTEQGS